MPLRQALLRAWPLHRSAIGVGAALSLTLGLAPFVPHAHIYKQLTSLARGELSQWIDIFDLLLHGAPWLFLVIVVARWLWAATAIRTGRAFERDICHLAAPLDRSRENNQ